MISNSLLLSPYLPAVRSWSEDECENIDPSSMTGRPELEPSGTLCSSSSSSSIHPSSPSLHPSTLISGCSESVREAFCSCEPDSPAKYTSIPCVRTVHKTVKSQRHLKLLLKGITAQKKLCEVVYGNLSTRDKTISPKVSLVQRFHCITLTGGEYLREGLSLSAGGTLNGGPSGVVRWLVGVMGTSHALPILQILLRERERERERGGGGGKL